MALMNITDNFLGYPLQNTGYPDTLNQQRKLGKELCLGLLQKKVAGS